MFMGLPSEDFLEYQRKISIFPLRTANSVSVTFIIQIDQLVASLPVQIFGEQTMFLGGEAAFVMSSS